MGLSNVKMGPLAERFVADPSNAGQIYVSTDTGEAHLSTGTALVGVSRLNKIVAKSANFTVNLATEQGVIVVDSTSGVITAELPATHTAGSLVTIKRTGANNVVIDPADADTVDGAASLTLSADNQVARLISNGTNWLTI